MLDKRCFALLGVIDKECSDTGYKIFSIGELIELMPKGLGLEIEGLKDGLNGLANHEFISIKYLDDSEVCLRPLIKGRVAVESRLDKELSDIKAERRFMVFAFLGGLFGGLLSGLIILLIKLLGGLNAI